MIEFNSVKLLKEGVDKLANAVKVTLGPKGRNVVIQNEYGEYQITKDGVTVAKSVELENKIENLGAKLVKDVAQKTCDDAGDGTTTSVMLTQAIVSEGLKNITAGSNPTELKKGIDKAVKHVVQYIKSTSKPVIDLESVATISANNDSEIGKLVANAMEKVNRTGIVTIEESKGIDTYIETVEGLKIDDGYLSSYFVTDSEKMECQMDNPFLCIYNKKLSNIKDILPSLQLAADSNGYLLLLVSDIEEEVLTTLIANKLRNGLKICVVKTRNLPEINKCEKAIISKNGTIIINSDNTESKVAVIHVGANSEVEMKEKKDRIEDALCATKSAIEEGIVIGGGMTYVNASRNLNISSDNSDEQIGINIIKKALLVPIKQLASNNNREGVIEQVGELGYNAKTDTFEKLVNIVDSAKVSRVALENAASIASMLLTTECVIVK